MSTFSAVLLESSLLPRVQNHQILYGSSANRGKSTDHGQYYESENRSVWNVVVNTSRICRAYLWRSESAGVAGVCPTNDEVEIVKSDGDGFGKTCRARSVQKVRMIRGAHGIRHLVG